MSTWFDQLRGRGSGRVPLAGAPDGAFAFVLGGPTASEIARLSVGDFTEVRQIVDLTGCDLVAATVDVEGPSVNASYQAPAGWSTDPDLLLWYDLNVGGPSIPSILAGRPALAEVGEIETDLETYSPDLSRCRRIPAGTYTAALAAYNNPAAVAAPLTDYTLQWWWKFDGYPTIPGSTGVHPIIFALLGVNDGIQVRLRGAGGPGAHTWYLDVLHRLAGVDTQSVFLLPVLKDPFDWEMWSLVFREGSAPPAHMELWRDGVGPVGPFATPFSAVGVPDVADVLQYGSPQLWGEIDAVRWIGRALAPGEIAASRAECVTAPSAVPVTWVMSLLIDGVVYGTRRVLVGERRRWIDFAAPVRLLTGPHEVAFRLGLVVDPGPPM